jgi:hypothetical protein
VDEVAVCWPLSIDESFYFFDPPLDLTWCFLADP